MEARSGIVLVIVSTEIIYSLNIPALHLQLQQHQNILPPSLHLPPQTQYWQFVLFSVQEGNMKSLRSTKTPHAIRYVCAWPGLAPRYFHQYLDKKYVWLKSAELMFKVDRRISSIEFMCTA